MELKLIEKKEQPLLNRSQIIAELPFAGAATPKRIDVAKALGQQVKGEIVIRKIDAKFGQSKAKVIAYAYTDQASKERIETKRGKKEKKEKKQKNKTPKVE